MSSDLVRFADPGPLDAPEAAAIEEACRRVVESRRYILGTEVATFEMSWASFSEAAGAVGVANGLDAIEIGLRALGVGPGDEVVVPAMSAMATALSVIRAGAIPVFCDIDPTTGLIDMHKAESVMTPRTRAVVPVHLYGRAVDMARMCDLARSRDLVVVEDAAQAHGARFSGRTLGTWGHAGAFSFYPTKNLGALGDAGALVSNDPAVLNTARELRNYGQREQYEHERLGFNSRLDELQAAILSARLPLLAERTAERQRVACRYFSEITNPHVAMLAIPEDIQSYVAHLFVVRVDDRRSFVSHMQSAGVECLVHYPRALPDQPAAAAWVGPNERFVSARRHAETCVSIPCRPGLKADEVSRVVAAANEYKP